MTMYLGPYIPGIVKHNQIFNYEPTEIIAKAVEKSAFSKYLFVDLDGIAEHKRQLKTPGNLLYVANEKVFKEIWT